MEIKCIVLIGNLAAISTSVATIFAHPGASRSDVVALTVNHDSVRNALTVNEIVLKLLAST